MGDGKPCSAREDTEIEKDSKAKSRESSPESRQFIEGRRLRGDVTRGPLGRLYASTEDGQEWTKNNYGPWRPVTTNEPPPRQGDKRSNTFQVVLAIQSQLPGAPDHWGLVVGKEEGLRGHLYQVQGDPEYMRYVPEEDSDILASSPLRGSYIMNPSITEQQHTVIRYWAENTPPPRAVSAAAVKANCQHWTIDVLERLQGEGVVTQSKVDEAKRYKQLLPSEQLDRELLDRELLLQR